jgi:hypothetical protein
VFDGDDGDSVGGQRYEAQEERPSAERARSRQVELEASILE